jgi:hypothetical protein
MRSFQVLGFQVLVVTQVTTTGLKNDKIEEKEIMMLYRNYHIVIGYKNSKNKVHIKSFQTVALSPRQAINTILNNNRDIPLEIGIISVTQDGCNVFTCFEGIIKSTDDDFIAAMESVYARIEMVEKLDDFFPSVTQKMLKNSSFN